MLVFARESPAYLSIATADHRHIQDPPSGAAGDTERHPLAPLSLELRFGHLGQGRPASTPADVLLTRNRGRRLHASTYGRYPCRLRRPRPAQQTRLPRLHQGASAAGRGETQHASGVDRERRDLPGDVVPKSRLPVESRTEGMARPATGRSGSPLCQAEAGKCVLSGVASGAAGPGSDLSEVLINGDLSAALDFVAAPECPPGLAA